MTNHEQVARRTRHSAILAEVAVEEAEAARAEADEKTAPLDVPTHLRIDSELDQKLRQRASDEHIPTSALVRRLLRQALQHGRALPCPQLRLRASRAEALDDEQESVDH